MKFRQYILILILLVSVTGCQSIKQSFAEPFAAPILFSFKLSPITAVSITHKDSLGHWPQSRDEVRVFYYNNREAFDSDSLFHHYQFNEHEFDSLNFTVHSDDSLIIDFISKPLQDSLYSTTKINDIEYLKGIGSMIIFPDSSNTANYSSQIALKSVTYYDSNMNELAKLE